MSKLPVYEPQVKLQWVTPDAQQAIVDLARVSVPNSEGRPVGSLLSYLATHQHWSPFEMASMCVELYAPRDITHQLVRHWSMRFQEFSGRYAEYQDSDFVLRECRTQNATNRQMSDQTEDEELTQFWTEAQESVHAVALFHYRKARRLGIAKEQARALLPEGMVLSRMFATASLRSWITYFKVRQTGSGAQGEHSQLAEAIAVIFREQFPEISTAFNI